MLIFCVRTENCYVVVLVDKEYIVSPVRGLNLIIYVYTSELGTPHTVYICYLPDGRSVLEKYFVEVSKTARGRRPRDVFETETKYFSVRTELNVNNVFIFSCVMHD